ncbi:lambda family phage tail tape measure protein [Acinetobacter baumannii 45075_6]|uniref:phage tail tip lysozyme n=1 Tax=Acinetobacter baumannii TaxID=470 RepID=UPI0004507EE4|nr:phage tail tip lysozyme [Acinetobacter baumannii]EYD39437.1 lambda family phage tail tape measure protein [Acinetobacter baumannii 25493_6]EYS17557.1 lambda family phage tail tape measure protein [Acinetobacter baumannii 25569_3]KCW40959.1 lambda family phage tail tape measure protein [Acinetobacter baumannii 45075_6]KCX06387.1 lambda family phage tail tape measure protein [Acinetobacter baumannii 45075_8]KCX71609.1 lambda family phage tail tape measure protein [Acinetobacter baumannii 4507
MANSNHNDTVLSYDELGFIIGMKRVEKKVSTIDSNIEKIIGILTQSFEEQKAQFAQPQPKLTEFQKMLNAVNNRQALDFEDLLKDKANPITQSFVVADKLVKDFADVLDQSINDLKTVDKKQINKSNGRKPAIEINSHDDLSKIVNPSVPERDEKGRFVSNPNEPQNQSSIRKVAQTISTAIKGVMPNSTQGVDPTVDAINEVGHLLSPVRRAAGLALRPLTGLMRSKKRNEPLPREQENHNRKQIKLLQRIADNLASKGGLLGSLGKLLTSVLSAGGGLLGGALGKGKKGVGKLGKGLGKFLKFGRGLPVIGALAAGASLLDWNEQSTQEKGGTVGSLAGGVIGGTVGSLIGPAGTLIGGMAGSWIGNKLGTVVAPYFKEWTDSLIAADVPGIINTAWKGFVSYASNAFEQAKGTASKVVDGVKETAGDTLDFIKDKFNRFNPFHDGVPTWGIGQGVYKPGFGANANVAQYGATVAQPVNQSAARDEALKFFTSKEGGNWSPEKAAGIVANLEAESGFKHTAIGDSGKAFGIGQWHPDRQAKFKQKFGKDIRQSSYQEQLAFVNWELNNNESSAGKKLRQSKSANQAGAIVSRYYERPAAVEAEAMKRSAMAQNIHVDAGKRSLLTDKQDNSKTLKDVEAKTVKSASGIEPKQGNIYNQTSRKLSGVLSSQTPHIPTPKRDLSSSGTSLKSTPLTKVPAFKQPLNTPNPQEVVVVNGNNGNIGQNVNDRFLAHALTGGIGMGNLEG